MNECKLVEDLLPLYAEDLISEESADFIRGHCAGCEHCAKLLRRSEEVIPMKTEMPNYKKALKRDRTQSVLLGIGLTILVLTLVFAIFNVGSTPQKLDVEPVLLESPDGVHSVCAEPYTSPFGLNQGLYITWKSGKYSGSEGTREFWMEILDAQWSPDGSDVLLTVRMKNGETRMEIWFDNYDEYGNGNSGIFPVMTKDGWDYRDLTAEFTALLRERDEFPTGWDSITYEFVEWGQDCASACFNYKTDNGHTGTLWFGFNYDYENRSLWIIE